MSTGQVSRPEVVRVLHLILVAMVLLSTYALARPTAESFFLEHHGSASLPWVWLAVAGAAIIAGAAYARAAARFPLRRILMMGSLVAALGFVLLAFAVRLAVPGAAFVLYVWKDMYIVILLETFWAIANATFDIRAARWIYGSFLVAGSVGGLLGNQLLGWLTERWGTGGALLGTVPLLALLAALTAGGAPVKPGEVGPVATLRKSPVPMAAQWQRLLRSRYLILLATVIASVQVVVAIVDAAFNGAVESTFLTTDARTAAIGAVYRWIDLASPALQLASGPILRYVGVPAVLLLVPLAIAGSLVGFVTSGSYTAVAVAKIVGKVCDYSIFRAAKEILYIPLDYAEKSEGKGLVDILAYRVSKGGASLLLLGLSVVGATAFGPWVALALTGVWAATTVSLVRAFRARRLGDRHEARGG